MRNSVVLVGCSVLACANAETDSGKHAERQSAEDAGSEPVARDRDSDAGGGSDRDRGTCGNGRLDAWDDGLGHRGVEDCDDGNDHDGDGCSSACYVEAGYTCNDDEPSECSDARVDDDGPPLSSGGMGSGAPVAPSATTSAPDSTGAPTASPSGDGLGFAGALGRGGETLGPSAGAGGDAIGGGGSGVGAAGTGGSSAGGSGMGGVAAAGGFGGLPPAGGNAGIGGAGPDDCGGVHPLLLSIDETLQVKAECNAYAIGGSFTCLHDDFSTPVNCIDNVPEYRPDVGVCLQGSTTWNSDAWGAAIALSLNDQAGELLPYDATAHGVVGFEIHMTGSSDGQPIRLRFVDDLAKTPPFIEMEGPGQAWAMISDAQVPVDWDVPEAGTFADPTHLYQLQIQFVGGLFSADYDFCVVSIQPILAD